MVKTNTLSERITIRIPQEVKELLQEKADKNYMKLNTYCRYVLVNNAKR